MRASVRWPQLLLPLLCCLAFASARSALAGDGAEFVESLRKQQALVDDEKLLAYVRAVGLRTATAAGRPDIQFFVVDNSSVNAQAFGDGYVVVYRGLLSYLRREDQLAGVLGHEVAHITLRHTQQDANAQLVNRITAFAASLITLNGDIGDVIQQYGAKSLSRSHREFELQSDHAGAEYMMAAGYDPQAMIEMVQILKSQQLYAKQVAGQNSTYHALFASHPSNDQRLLEAVNSVGGRGLEEAQDPVDDYLARIEGLTWGNAGAGGAVRGQSYYHGRLGFVLTAPDGWRLLDSSTKLMAYLPGGATEGFVSMEMDTAREGMSAEDMIVKVLKPGTLKDGARFMIKDGDKEYEAYSATIVTPAGTPGTSMIAVVLKQGRCHIFRAETREPKAADALRAGFTFMLEHLREITYADLKVANTERIALYEVQPGDTYESLAQGSPIPANAANELRLLNGDFPNGQPRAGDRIKVVR